MNESFNPTPEGFQKVRNKLLRLMTLVPRSQVKEVFDEISQFGTNLRLKYPEWKRYEAYHALAGSTLEKTASADFYLKEDFPGEDSVEAFVERLIIKYKI